MPRNMSFALTTQQVIDMTKDVTRRSGWKFLKPGDVCWAVEKAMGLKKGERIKRLGLIKVVRVTREMLCDITDADVVREGFSGHSRYWFIDMYCRHNGGDFSQEVTRIQFEYVKFMTCAACEKEFVTPIGDEKSLCRECHAIEISMPREIPVCETI